MKNQLKGTLILLLTALVWGCAFVAQSSAAGTLSTFPILAARYLMGGLVLLPVIWLRRKAAAKADFKKLLFSGLVCGGILCLASGLQQFGLEFTTPGKAGFITSLYILGVPIIGLFAGKKIASHVWLCIAAGVVGLYLLCMDGSFVLSTGDIMVILCAVVFSFHIVAVDYFVRFVDGVQLACAQFFTAGIIALVLMLFFEKPQMDVVLDSALPILYLGLMSTGVGYTLQIVGQKYCSPTLASLAMSFESVFAVVGEMVVFGLIMGRDVAMSSREIIGCIVMFAAIMISQLPAKKERVHENSVN